MGKTIGRLAGHWTKRLSAAFCLLMTTTSVHAAEAATIAAHQTSSGDDSGLVGLGLAALGIAGLILIRRQSSLL